MEHNQKFRQILRDVVKTKTLTAWSKNLIDTIELHKDDIIKHVEENPSNKSIQLSDFIDFGEVVKNEFWFECDDAAFCIGYHFDFVDVSLWVESWQKVPNSNIKRGKLTVNITF